MALELLIFDCDGVLFDSERANLAFYREVLRRAGAPPLPPEAEAACHALSAAQLFEQSYGDRPELLRLLRETAQTTDYTPFYDLMFPRPGLRTLLRELGERYTMAMATNRGLTVHGVLARFGLEDCFDLAVGVLDVARPKPHPDMLLCCAERAGVAVDAAVYVGDQATDAAAARAAGMAFVGMPPVAAAEPLAIATLDELPARLREIASGP